MRFIKKMFAKKVNPTEENEVFIKCGECSMSQEQYPHTPFHYEILNKTNILCEYCHHKHLNSSECSCRSYITEEEELEAWDESPECLGMCQEAHQFNFYYLNWRRMPRPKIDYSNEPQVWGFIIEHPRTGYDRVYFGPFRTREELSDWMDRIGRPRGVSGSVYPIMNPHGDPEDFWYIPRDMPWSETLKPKKDRPHINGEYSYNG